MPITNAEHIFQYARIHRTKVYGRSGREYAIPIQACLLDLRPATVLEYGCGQSGLAETLELADANWVRYDPAIPEYAHVAVDHADFVVNTDVMEHIPAADVDDVLAHIRSFSQNAFFSIATRPAAEILPNGNNAHCTVWSARRWLSAIGRRFPEAELVHVRENHSCVITTWHSPVRRVIAEIETWKQAAKSGSQRSFASDRRQTLKSWERGVRSFRDRLVDHLAAGKRWY